MPPYGVSGYEHSSLTLPVFGIVFVMGVADGTANPGLEHGSRDPMAFEVKRGGADWAVARVP